MRIRNLCQPLIEINDPRVESIADHLLAYNTQIVLMVIHYRHSRSQNSGLRESPDSINLLLIFDEYKGSLVH